WRPGALTGTKGSVTGILRNRLYIGEFHWGRTTRKRSRRQGKIKVKATPVSERLVQQMPQLRIVDDELFEAVQERLEARSAPNFNEHRHPEYLFTRKIYCSECGERLAVYNKRLGCTGHALKGTCKVSRRVSREALEQAVLDGLKEHLLAAELIEPALVEYRAEMERALAEQQSRSEFGVVRLRDIERHIENVMAQIREGSVQGLGRKLLSGELERLETERQTLKRDIARKPRIPSPDLSAETIVERLRRLLDDLRGALEGKDREAVRARDLIRGMIERIVVTPLPAAKEDGRGAGPVSVKVEGRVAELLELAEIQLGRDIQHGSCPKTVQDGSIVTFFFDVVVPYENPRLTGVYADVPIISRLLDAAATPVGKSMMMAALARERPCAPDDKPNELELRVRRATDHMRSNGKIRRIHLGPKTGWVWNHLPITDEQWRDRLSDPVFIPASMQEANLHTSGLEGHLAKLMGSAGPLNEAVGEDAAIKAEDHGMRRRARAKPDWAKRHSARAKLSAARNARGGRRE
ncbi:MAG: recombinase family protein, partial [Ignavibacteriales bacterium]